LPSRAILPLADRCLRSSHVDPKDSPRTVYQEDNVSVVKSLQTSSLIPVRESPDRDRQVRRAACRDACWFDAAAEWHHARLRTLENDDDALLELLELAVTWHELEYSATTFIPPDEWPAFAQGHRWASPARVERIFSLATDVAMTAERAVRQRPGVPAR
jgi:hypothetical protein